jgi:fucose permease
MKITHSINLRAFSLILPGTLAGPALGIEFLWFWPVYLLFLLLVLYRLFFPGGKGSQSPLNLKASLGLLDNTWVFFMALGLFLCAGAEVSVSTALISWLGEEHLLAGLPLWGAWLMFPLSLIGGRFMQPMILRLVQPRPQLLFAVLFVVAGILMLIMGGLPMTVAGIVLTGLGLANIFTLITSLMRHRLPGHESEIRGLMLLAVPGAAFLPPLMHWINYGGGMGLGFVVPLFSVLYVFFLAIISGEETISE